MNKLKKYFGMQNVSRRQVLWLLAAVLAFFVMPLGLIMTVLLMRAEEKKHPAGNYVMRGIGFGLMVFAMTETVIAVCFVGAGIEVLYVAAVFFASALIGLWMYLRGRQLQKTDRLHEVLHQVIHVSHITSTQELAQTMGMKRVHIDREVSRMIRWGVLKDAQLDIASAKILLPKEEWADVRVVCKECGAELVINIGHTLVCPFCKTAL